jgi:multidrug efflux pump subunit AcrA (membrane-fusion protein)
VTRRRTWVTLGVTALVVAGGCTATGLVLAQGSASTGDEPTDRASVELARVERQDLADVTTTPGELDYADQQPLQSGLSGTLTGLPEIGDVIKPGGTLYRVDNTPVVLLRGELPPWRRFDVSMSAGKDVVQLEENLRGLGFFDDTPDERFDWVTREAVRDWEESLGLPRTGAVELGRVVFEPGPRRVGAVAGAVGDRTAPGSEVLTLTGRDRTVSVQLPVADQRLAREGAAVTVRIPGGTETPGRVTAVGSPVEVPNGSDKSVVVPVTVELKDPGAAGELQRISVTVGFREEVHEQVLAVPVTALIALPGGGLGVEKQGAGGDIVQTPVETGAFVQGFVEITGGDLAEGDHVVVPG